ncbi:hypothetical protein BPOR_0007g00420 [Botrytis porri]|uniref:Uncharacterized protein n=1 Tax=Botrytis porri TaxID=87229 RepID=A0A4Z1L6B8_9HELO|nr:hypothetical protein BPOR_0007g00420 [Botrytis porri]
MVRKRSLPIIYSSHEQPQCYVQSCGSEPHKQILEEALMSPIDEEECKIIIYWHRWGRALTGPNSHVLDEQNDGFELQVAKYTTEV